jgi:hypothetical protein
MLFIVGKIMGDAEEAAAGRPLLPDGTKDA